MTKVYALFVYLYLLDYSSYHHTLSSHIQLLHSIIRNHYMHEIKIIKENISWQIEIKCTIALRNKVWKANKNVFLFSHLIVDQGPYLFFVHLYNLQIFFNNLSF